MKKILVLGSSGMLGHVVTLYLTEICKLEVVDVSHNKKLRAESLLLDIKNASELENLVSSQKPDIIVNCIGVLIKGSKSDSSNAIYINSYFPHQLANFAKKIGCRLIHISTDCVFSGKWGNYRENDLRDAYDVYGMSKALGEVIDDYHLTFRTSIIGPEIKLNGEGLFHWMSQQSGEISGYTQAFWTGITTIELAKAIGAAIDQNISGLYHIVSPQKISKFELLNLINDEFCMSLTIQPSDSVKIDKSLSNSRHDFKFNVCSYELMIHEMKAWMRNHSNFYDHYKSMLASCEF